MEVSAGEYGYQPLYFRRMLEAEAVDVSWVYAQTGPDVFRVRAAVERVALASEEGRSLRIGIYTLQNPSEGFVNTREVSAALVGVLTGSG